MVIGEIERNPTEMLRISKESFKGKDYLDIRIYYLSDQNEWKPTKKGVTVSPEKIEEFSEIVKKAQDEFTQGSTPGQ